MAVLTARPGRLASVALAGSPAPASPPAQPQTYGEFIEVLGNILQRQTIATNRCASELARAADALQGILQIVVKESAQHDSQTRD